MNLRPQHWMRDQHPRRRHTDASIDAALNIAIAVTAIVLTAAMAYWLIFPSSAHAQATERLVRFGATTVTGSGSVTPVLSWCTERAVPPSGGAVDPVCGSIGPAASCAGTGPANWAGAKAPAGSETLPAISGNQTYGLECSWPDDTTIRLTWTNPTQNEDNSPLTDLQDVQFKFRQGAGTLLASTPCLPATGGVRCEVANPPVSPQTYGGFALGTWRIVAFARDAATPQNVSQPSGEASKVNLAASTVNRNITITVDGPPAAVVGLVAE